MKKLYFIIITLLLSTIIKAILDRNAIYTDADGNTYNRTIKKFNYRGRGASSVTNETDIKQSANFVKKGPDGRIYVAYGMYGLQIYEF